MTINLTKDGVTLLEVTPDDTSYRYRKMGGENRILLNFSTPRFIQLPVGATLAYQGRTYTMYSPATITKINERNWQYSLTLDAPQELLRKWRMKHRTYGAVKFHLTAKPEEHLRMLVDCANASDPTARVKWSLGECIDAPEKLVTYNHTDLLSALGTIAKTFDTEFEIDDKQIRLRKVEYYKDRPLELSYGKGKGLRSGVKRENDSKATRLSRLYVQGTDRNIEYAKYGAKTLHLPKGVSVRFDGDKFEGEVGYIASRAHSYKVSADGLYVDRVGDPEQTGNEGSVEATDIYPSRVGAVSSVTEDGQESKTKHALYSVYDSSIPESLDFAKSLIPNQPLQVVFQSGVLAGVTLEAHYYHKAEGGKQARRLALIPKEEDGVVMPSAKYLPKVGDKYAVVNVNLPQSYIRDDKTKTGAEWELLRRALKSLYQSSMETYVYRAELDGLWTKRDWLNRGGRIRLGAYVRLSDAQLIPGGVDIRIVGVKDYLNAPESPEIELSNNAVGSSILSTIEQLKDSSVRSEDKVAEIHRESRRTLQQAIEASEQVARAMGDRFSKSVSPVAVHTMQLIAGDPSLQFRFVSASGDTIAVAPTYNKATKVMTLPACTLEHQTIDQPLTLTSGVKKGTLRKWSAGALDTPPLTDSSKSYYTYLQCNKTGGSAKWIVSDTPIPFDGGVSYNLLAWLLSSEDNEGDRSFTRLYGFTEILPGQIRTEKIATPDGSAYFDLQSGVIASKSIRFVYPDGSLHEYPNDYLHKSIREGTTEIQGGLVLGSIIGAKGNTGAVVSYLSGTASLPAFACGVTGFGTSSYKAITELRHNGTGHIGAMHIEQGGEVVTFRPEGRGYTTVRIGGGQAKLEDLKDRSEQDSRGSVQIPRQSHDLRDTEVRKTVTLLSTAVRVLNAGSTMTLSLPVSVDAYSATNWYAEVNSKVEISVKMESSRGDVAYSKFIGLSFSEEIDYKNPGKPGKRWKATLERTLEDEIVGLQDDIYTLKVEAYMSVNYIKDDFHTDESAWMGLSTNPTTGEYRIKGVNSSAREVVFSQQGMSAFFGKTRFLYLQGQATGGDDTFLTVRGKTDMPGVLLGGRVEPRSVSFEHTWGAKRDSLRVDRIGRGLYKIYHAIGHKQYTVVCNAAGNGGHNASYVEIETNYFTIRTNHDDGTYDDVWFSFVVIGENYV